MATVGEVFVTGRRVGFCCLAGHDLGSPFGLGRFCFCIQGDTPAHHSLTPWAPALVSSYPYPPTRYVTLLRLKRLVCFCTRCGDNAANGDETPHITTSCRPVLSHYALGPSLSPGNWFSGLLSSLWLDVRWVISAGMSLVGVNSVLPAGTSASFLNELSYAEIQSRTGVNKAVTGFFFSPRY